MGKVRKSTWDSEATEGSCRLSSLRLQGHRKETGSPRPGTKVTGRKLDHSKGAGVMRETQLLPEMTPKAEKKRRNSTLPPTPTHLPTSCQCLP